jgi:FkbM family methyltransferase
MAYSKLINTYLIVLILFAGLYMIFKSNFTINYISNESKLDSNQYRSSILNRTILMENFFDDIFEISDNQRLFNKKVLLETVKFMIKESTEEDADLVEFVRSLIHSPSTKPLNLNDKNRKDFSQIGQSGFINDLLKSKTKGFYIEAGGFDGESHSNSLFFEMTKNWNGILIEPLPYLFKTLLSKNRKAYAINACIAKSKPIIAKFRDFNVLSGRVETMSDIHNQRIDRESNNANKNFLYIPCFSLSTILKAINVSRVDYFSLDVEGGENDVLKTIDYNKIFIKTFSIEHNGNNREKDLMVEHLTKFGYRVVKSDSQDIYFLKD